tara:strand:+ start:2744 stop:2953 length:210 start_codon:yes stop_codon:yes gene_type:complete
MREPESCNIEYCGYSNPRSPNELDFEILGLESVIKIAEQRIAALRQSRYLAEYLSSNSVDQEVPLNEDI